MHVSRRRLSVVAVLALAAGILVGLHQAPALHARPAADEGDVLRNFKQLTDGFFLENRGQWDAEARFRSGGGGGEVWFAPDRLMYALYRFPNLGEPGEAVADPQDPQDPDAPQVDAFADAEGYAVEVTFPGANEVEPVGGDVLPGEYNWIIGGEGSRSAAGARAHKAIMYPNLWDGIDLRFAGTLDPEGTVKSVLVVTPGADPADIAFRYDGHTEFQRTEAGAIVVVTPLGNIVEGAPVAYTEDGTPVAVRYRYTGDTLSFIPDDYDRAQTLYIDPSVNFSRDYGSSTTDFVTDMKENANGRYLLGTTFGTNFPIISGFRSAIIGSPDWYVIRFDFANNTHLNSTYLGGTVTVNGGDYSGSMELLANGDVVVSGHSQGPTFPGPGGIGQAPAPLNTTKNSGTQSGRNATIAQLDFSLGTLIDSAQFGGGTTTTSSSTPTGLARDSATGEWYLAGQTSIVLGLGGLGPGSPILPFQAVKSSAGTGTDGWITKLSANFDVATAFTYLGGTTTDGLVEVTLDAANTPYVGGFTFSTTFPFVRTAIIGSGNNGSQDFILAKLNSTLSAATYVTTVGGSATDGWIGTSYLSQIFGVLGKHQNFPLAGGRLVHTGTTSSTDYPTAGGPLQAANAGNFDQVLSILNAGGTALDESTYIGGSSTDEGSSIEQNAAGRLWLTGLSASANFPVVNPVQAANGGNYDFTVTLFDGVAETSALIASTYWGGTSTDFGMAIFDGPTNFRTRVAGPAFSTNWPQIPAGSPTFGPGGGYDGGVVDINFGGARLVVSDTAIESIPFQHDLDCLTAGDFLTLIVEITNVGLEAQPDNPGPEFEGEITGPHGPITGCTATSGTCSISGNQVFWNGSLAPGASVTLTFDTRVLGGVPAGSGICIVGQLNFDPGTGTNSQTTPIETICAILDCPPTVDPNRQLFRQVHLPVLNFQGQDDVCRTWIEVQVVGPEPSKAVLVTWGEPGFCPPQCAGPLKVECSGLLVPGSTWNFLGAQVPTGSKSGMLFKFTAAQLSEFGLDQVFGFDDVIADLMCETLFFGVVGDCDDYRRFKKAYTEGLDFAGINQVIAAGPGVLAVDVLRHCPGDVTPGVEVSGKYNGIAGAHLGAYDPVFGGFAYYAPLLYADKAGFNSIMYIQNGGIECSSVEIWFKAQDDCLRARICEIFTLAPGETYQFDATDCVGPDWQGSAWLRSSQPLGIVVDIIGRDVLMTYIGEPAELNFTFDPTGAFFTGGNQVAYGPLVYSEYQGWDSGVQVQNLSSVTAAKVKVYFLDRSGDIITTLVDWICPRGSQTFFLPVIANLPGNWVGSVRAESQEWWSPGDPIVAPSDIVGVATLLKYNDAARTAALEALAYNLLPEHKAFDWQIGFGGGSLDSGIALLAVPSLLKDLDTTGVTSELAIANLVPKPGFTDFAIYIYDQNGLLDFVCEKLNEKQVEYIDLQTWGYVNPGFKGSAIISAVFWEHEVFDDTGFFLRNLVGLAAVAVERTGTRLGEDIPGDEAAGDRAIPFRESLDASGVFDFTFLGPEGPFCPGVPPFAGFPVACVGCPPASQAGALAASDPTYNRPNTVPCAAGGTLANYDAYQYTLCAAGPELLTLSMCPALGGSATYDSYIVVYQPTFNPAAPCANLVALNDDFCGLSSQLSTTIQPGPFVVVVTAFATGQTGSYTMAITLECGN